MSCDELHDECEIIVRTIEKVDWQTIVLLVERELEIALGTTGADVLPGFEVVYPSIPCGVFTCHMYVMSHLVILQYLATEWTYRRRPIIFLDLRHALQWKFIEEIHFHTLLKLNHILYESMKIATFLVWCMEHLQFRINIWNA